MRIVRYSTIIIVLLIIAACGARNTQPEVKLTVNDVWMRPALQGGTTGAYMEITNQTDKSITLNSVTADVAEQIEIFQSVVENNDIQSVVLENGVSIGAGETLRFQFNGYYIGLNYLQTNLSAGDKVTLNLQFSNNETLSVEALVKNEEFDRE